MTEKEKMLAGEFYDSRDPELLALYHKARKLLGLFNTLDSENVEEKMETLMQLFDFAGAGTWIESPFYCDYGVNISIGENTFINTNCVFLDSNRISIGKNGLIAPNVQIYTASHPVRAADRIRHNRYLTFSRPVSIGDNVWIGGNAVIIPGVTIGENVTIGAGSVVTKDLGSNVLAAGNPCRVIRNL